MSSDPTPPEYNPDDDESKNDEMFASAISPSTATVPLDDDDDTDEDDNDTSVPFGLTSNQSVVPEGPTSSFGSMRNDQHESSVEKKKNDDSDDEDPFGTKKPTGRSSVPTTPSAPVLSTSPEPTPYSPSQLYPSTFSSSSSPRPSGFDTQVSSSAPDYKADYNKTESGSATPRQRLNEDDIEIAVSDPTKIGDGMSSYMVYRITTKTSLTTFKKSEFSVSRRFSDFLGLHAKLVHKHLNAGLIIPSPPEKDAVGMAKVKISKEDNIPSDFIDRRRALLERYLNRLTKHDKLIADPDVQEFLELDKDLPKSKDTAALSGAGVMRAVTGITSSVSKLGTKTGEQDQWFEERHTTVFDMHTTLKNTYNRLNILFSQRKEAGIALRQFFTSLNHLATVEEHPSLSHALTELANLKEKIDQINNDHSYKEYSILTELIKEYMSLLEMVQLAFNERIKIHQQWLNAEDTLRKRREEKTKLEQSPKGADKIPQKEADIRDWETRVEISKQHFERISANIKEEMEIFEETRLNDFEKSVNTYLQTSIEQQEKVLELWEGYLPQVNEITV